eukprot:jgi/Astpho2/2789/Aster-00958
MTQQVWLPSLRVWARAPQGMTTLSAGTPPSVAVLDSSLGTSMTDRKRKRSASPIDICSSPEPDEPVYIDLSDEPLEAAVEGEPNVQCSICLTEEQPSCVRAVVGGCMHAFCRDCLEAWLAVKPICPLCKRRVRFYMHSIKSDASYEEEAVPDSPPRKMSALEEGTEALPVIGHVPGNADSSLLERMLHGHMRAHYTLRQQQQQHPPQGHSSRGHGHSRLADSSARQIRWPEASAAPEDKSVQWRRHLYDNQLFAGALDVTHRGLPRVASESGRQPRLEKWVQRELQAVLGQQDVGVTRSFVLALVGSYGLGRQAPRLQGLQAPAGSALEVQDAQDTQRHRDAVVALSPFLHDHTEQFWHELRCFGHAPFVAYVYDRMVHYFQKGSQQGHGVLVAQRVRTSEWTLWNTQSSAATGTVPSWHLPAPGPLPEVANSDSAAAGRLPQEATSWPGVGSGPHNGSAGEGRPRRRSRWDAEAPICPEPAALDRTSGTAVPGSQAVPAGQQAPASGDWGSSSPQARRRSGHEREHRRHEAQVVLEAQQSRNITP